MSSLQDLTFPSLSIRDDEQAFTTNAIGTQWFWANRVGTPAAGGPRTYQTSVKLFNANILTNTEALSVDLHMKQTYDISWQWELYNLLTQYDMSVVHENPDQ